MSKTGPIAILGGTGMLGQALATAAALRGHSAVRVARHAADLNCDLTHWVSTAAVLDSIAPTTIINCAAQTNLDACQRDPGGAYLINAKLVADLATYCMERQIKLVQISTDHYFSGDGLALHDEASPVMLKNEYARTKFAGEQFSLTLSNTLVLRTNIVGLRHWAGRPTFVEWVLDGLRNQVPMTLFSDFVTSSIDVESFAAIALALLEQRRSGLVNVGSRDAVSKAEFIKRLANGLGLSLDQCRIGSVTEMPGCARAESLGLDVGRAQTWLGQQLPDTDAVIANLIRIIKEHQHAI